MNKQEVAELVSFVNMSYPYQIQDVNATINAWLEILQQYDYEDVKLRLKTLMQDDKYQKTCPTVYYIVRDLRAIQEKINWNKGVIYCDICGRAFNKREELVKHEDRCRSIRYIIKQSKKLGKDISNKKRELFEMSQLEFDKKYNELLNLVYKNSRNDTEKRIIEFIFNQPTPKEAQEFLNRAGV